MARVSLDKATSETCIRIDLELSISKQHLQLVPRCVHQWREEGGDVGGTRSDKPWDSDFSAGYPG